MDEHEKLEIHGQILLESGTNELEIVEFQLNEKATTEGGPEEPSFYGINVAKVREIIKPPKITHVPNTEMSIEGMFNFRGTVIPLINLAKWLGRSENFSDSARTIVVEFNNMINGFLVHGVSRIHRISWEQVEPTSNLSFASDQESIIGGVKFDDRIVMLLDFERIVSELNPQLQIGVESPVSTRPGEARPHQAHPPNILICDDSAIIRRLLSDTLSRAGYTVQVAHNGLEGLEILQETATKCQEIGADVTNEVQLLITDIEMPQMDGMHLTKRLKADERYDMLPIIIFSSIASEENRIKAKRVGADGYISKPEIHNLLQLVSLMMV